MRKYDWRYIYIYIYIFVLRNMRVHFIKVDYLNICIFKEFVSQIRPRSEK